MIELDGHAVEYSIRRSSRARRMQIQADIGTGITLVVPERLRRFSPDRFVRDHAAWVRDQLERIAAIRARAPRVEVRDGGTVPLLGHDCLIVHRPRGGGRTRARYDRGRIVVDRAQGDGNDVARDAVLTLVKSIAREILTARADHWCREIGVARRRLTVRSQRTRWGSCTTEGSLSLNWRLAFTPLEALDYVVVHEVAHIVHADHGPDFEALLDRFYPDWRTWDRWLDEVGVALTAL